MSRVAPLVILYGGLALASTWPLCTRLDTALPLGNEVVPTVPYVSAWALWWTADRLGHGFEGYWDAPIFHPEPGTFAFSEPMPLAGVLAAPLFAAGAPAALAYNVWLLVALTLNGLLGYWLCRVLRLPPLPSALGGAVLSTLPFVHHQLGVLALVPLAGVLGAIGALVLCARRPSALRGAALGLALACVFLLCAQYALLLGLALLVATPLLVRRARLRDPRSARALLAALVICGALAAPVAYMQHARTAHHHFERSAERARKGSASVFTWLRSPTADLVPLPGVAVASPPYRRSLFPGAVRLALALAGAAFGLRSLGRRRTTAFLLGLAGAGVVLSVIAQLDLGPLSPYRALRAAVPGLDQMRSLWRAGVLTQIALALLLAQGLHALLWARSRFSRRWLARLPGHGPRRALQGAIVALALLELWPRPQALAAVPAKQDARALATWLRVHAERDRPLAAIPFPKDGSVEAYEATARFMYLGTFHGRSMVNGYSSYFPRRYERLLRRMRARAPDVDLPALEAAGVRVLIVQRAYASEARVPPAWPLVHADERLGIEIYARGGREHGPASRSHGLTPLNKPHSTPPGRTQE